mmetsp:Transcript_22009/g.56564  ORF Transcript_22009/g.56564 Transcript_22009/m.56564 type:complete len:98 (+) Transcript_22009:1133-1426(+)
MRQPERLNRLQPCGAAPVGSRDGRGARHALSASTRLRARAKAGSRRAPLRTSRVAGYLRLVSCMATQHAAGRSSSDVHRALPSTWPTLLLWATGAHG